MTKTSFMKQMAKIAVDLDVEGYETEAQTVAKIMNKLANVFDEDFNRMAEDDATPGKFEMFESDMPGETNIDAIDFREESVKAIVDSIADKITMMMPETSDREILQLSMDMTTDIIDRIKRLTSDRNM